MSDSFLEKLQQIKDTKLIPQTPINQKSKKTPSNYQDSDPSSSTDCFEKQKDSLIEIKSDYTPPPHLMKLKNRLQHHPQLTMVKNRPQPPPQLIKMKSRSQPYLMKV